jgi:hypothetical protein
MSSYENPTTYGSFDAYTGFPPPADRKNIWEEIEKRCDEGECDN